MPVRVITLCACTLIAALTRIAPAQDQEHEPYNRISRKLFESHLERLELDEGGHHYAQQAYEGYALAWTEIEASERLVSGWIFATGRGGRSNQVMPPIDMKAEDLVLGDLQTRDGGKNARAARRVQRWIAARYFERLAEIAPQRSKDAGSLHLEWRYRSHPRNELATAGISVTERLEVLAAIAAYEQELEPPVDQLERLDQVPSAMHAEYFYRARDGLLTVEEAARKTTEKPRLEARIARLDRTVRTAVAQHLDIDEATAFYKACVWDLTFLWEHTPADEALKRASAIADLSAETRDVLMGIKQELFGKRLATFNQLLDLTEAAQVGAFHR